MGTNITTFNVADGAAPVDLLVSGVLANNWSNTASGINKTGAGTMTLSAANTYTGTTTVSAGTLSVTGSVTNSLNVNSISGGTLSVDGGTVTVANGGNFSVGSSTAGAAFAVVNSGTLNIGNGLGTTYIGGKIANLGTAGTGTLTINGGIVNVAAPGNGVDNPNGFGDNSRFWINPYQTVGTSSIILNGGTLSTARSIQDGGGGNSAVVFNGGTLQAAASIDLVVNPTTATINAGGATVDTQAFNPSITKGFGGAGGLTKIGSGTLTLNGVNSFGGNTTISNGTLQIGGAGSLGSGNYAGAISNSGTLRYSSSAAQTLSGQITGGGPLVKDTSASVLTLTNGSNSYGGGTTITQGTVSFANGALGMSGNISLNGGTLQWNGANTQDVSSRIVMNNGVTATFDTNGNNVSFASGIGSGSTGLLTKTGAGTLTLAGTNTYTGSTTISTGSLQIGGAGSLASGSYAGSISNSGTFQYSSSAAQTLSGVISGAGSFVKDTGNGTLTLTNTGSSFTGNVAISQGQVIVSGGLLGANPTTSALGNTQTAGRTITVSNATLAFTQHDVLGNAGSTPVVQVILNSGGDLQSQSKLTTLGPVTLNGGTLTADGDQNVGAFGNFNLNGTVTVNGSTQSELRATNVTAGHTKFNLSNVGTNITTFNVADGAAPVDLLVSGVLANAWSGAAAGLTKTGAGAMTLSAANTYTGNTLASGGNLSVAASGSITNSPLFNVNNGGNVSLSGTISMAGVSNFGIGSTPGQVGTMTVNAGGVLNIGGPTGYTAIGGNNSAQGSAGGVGILTMNGGSVNVGAAGTNGSGPVGPGGGGGTDATKLWLNPYGGTGSIINLNAGVLSTARPIANGSGGTATFNFNGGTLLATATNFNILDIQGPFTVNVQNGGAIVNTNGNNATILPALLNAGSGGLTKNGNGTLTLNGTSTYVGATSVNAGTLRAGAAAGGQAFGSLSAVTLANASGATLDLNNFSQTIGSLAGGGASGGNVTLGSGTLTTGGNGNSTTFAGVISGASGQLVKTGAGTQTLSGLNTYSGATTVSGGTLSLGNGGSIINSAVTVQSGATLAGTGTTGSLTINAGGFHKPGNSPGTTTVTGSYNLLGNLEIEFLSDANVPGTSHDWVRVNNPSASVTLGGSSTLTTPYLGGGFAPGFGTVFTIIENNGAGAVSGTFSGLAAGSNVAVNGVNLKIYYNGNDGNDVVLVSNNPSPAPVTLYIDSTFSSPGVVDGDRELAGSQTAYVGTNAFANPADALTALSTFVPSNPSAFVITNGGSYPSANLAGGGSVILRLVNDTVAGQADVTLQNLSGDTNDGIVTQFHGGLGGNLIVEQGSFAGVISGNGTLEKTTGGTLTLTGTNTYNGATTVSAGVLNIQNSTALGTTAGGTTVASGAALELQGGVAVGAETLGLTGTGVSNNGALRNVSGANSWAGGVTLGGATEIQSDAGLLTLTGGIGAGANALTFDGAGNTTVATNGITGVGGSVTKNGAGTVLLSAVNTYNGSTTVNAGTLQLSGSLQNSNVAVNAGTFLQSGGTNNVTGTNGNLAVAAGASYQLQGGTLDFGDYAAGGTAWTPADTSAINIATGNQFSFTGGTLQDVSEINVANGSAFTQSGGNFVVGQDGIGPAAETTIDGGFSLLGGVLRLDVFGDDLTPESCCDGVPSNNDQLTVAGDALLDSAVSLNFVGSYEPEFGDVFTLICAADITLEDGFFVDGGFFRLVPTGNAEFPFALQAIVPEPASVAVWSLIGLVGAAGAWRSRRRSAG